MNELALFAGAGGGLLASHWLLGHRIVCHVENDPYCVEVIKARIRDGLLDDAPIWDDARTFDGRPWRGCVDIVSAGFPCQPFAQGGKRQGADDDRNVWPDTVRIIREIEPQWIFLENTSKLLSPFRTRGEEAYFNTILRDLARSGYDAEWGCLSASTLGANHKRRRLWIVAYPSGQGRPLILRQHQRNRLETHQGHSQRRVRETNPLDAIFSRLSRLEQRLGEPSIFGVNDGLAHRVDRLKATGNGQVPTVAAAAWRLLSQST